MASIKPVFHPKRDESDQRVELKSPTSPSASSNWELVTEVATFVPGGACPVKLNGIPFQAVREANDVLFQRYARKNVFAEPLFNCPAGYNPAAGALVVEPDGRVWLVHPSNQYGSHHVTFPKGASHGVAMLRETAVRETFEESGLLVELFDFLADARRSQSYTRYYLARRVSGSPTDMGWQSQAVSLVPQDRLPENLSSPFDQPVAQALSDRRAEWPKWNARGRISG
jgi:ADP-ribose pyrophosphatase YjhB (NUDIX family)